MSDNRALGVKMRQEKNSAPGYSSIDGSELNTEDDVSVD